MKPEEVRLKKALDLKSLAKHPAMFELLSQIERQIEYCDRQLSGDQTLIDKKELHREIWAKKNVYLWFIRLFTTAEKIVHRQKVMDISETDNDNI